MTLSEIIENALKEDIGDGDHTSLACILPESQNKALLIAKQEGIICGIDIAKEVYKKVDNTLALEFFKKDGDKIAKGDIIFSVKGSAIFILTGERTVLNFMQRMSGIATYTHHLTSLISHTHTKLLDTRKTTPNLRLVEKMAVLAGGGHNHRFGLYDMIMIKDNHIDFAGGIAPAIQRTKDYLARTNKNLKIEIEVRNFEELQQVLETGGIERIMFDNFSPENMKKAVEMAGNRFETEASGGITEQTIVAYAETGVDYLSVGALTHQIKSLDLSLIAEK